MDKKIYLVPYDFTETADGAVSVAVNMAHHNIGETMVELLHYVSNPMDKEQSLLKLNEVAKAIQNPGTTEIKAEVVVGNYLEGVGKMADTTHAKYVVMGTHGLHGLQKIFGSDALKIISNSTTPFIVVQDYVDAGNQFEKIVLPVNLDKESLQVMKFAADLAVEFNSKILVVSHKEKDEWLRHKVQNNIKLCKEYLTKHKIEHDVTILDSEQKVERQVIQYGLANGADLIAIAYFQESLLARFDTYAQKIITNRPNIPVLIINAEAHYKTTGGFGGQG